MNFSIRKRLLILLLSVICGVWGMASCRVYIETQHEVEELFDANLAQSARVLLGLVKHEMEEHKESEEEWIKIEEHLSGHLLGHRYEHKLAFLVRTHHGRILIRSAQAPLFPLPEHNPEHNLVLYSDYQVDHLKWRVFTLPSKTFFVQAAERYDIRNELITEIMSSTLSILIMALPLLAFLIWIIVGHSFKPLQQVATDIATRTSDQLQPLDTEKIAIEIKQLVNALNHLFIRLARAFENERRFTADAAHELRTPLAGLKTQAQVAQRATNSHQHHQALQQILIGVDRATHLVTQLLTLARMDATQTMHSSSVNLHELVNQLIIDLTPEALEKNLDLGLEKTATFCMIQGNRDALYLMLRNLIDNAIRYTPANGQVTVCLENRQTSQLTVTISDTGSGIPFEQREQIFERFYRGLNQNIQGSGLGLSIAQKVAQLHHTKIHINNTINGHGLCVQIDFKLSSE